jgi:hypothetical protein
LEYVLLLRLSHALLAGAAAEDEAVTGITAPAEATIKPAVTTPRDRPERLLTIEDSFVAHFDARAPGLSARERSTYSHGRPDD